MLCFPHFVQNCPVCGRPVQIRAEFAGRRMTCCHCKGRFVASDRVPWQESGSQWDSPLMRRADQLLQISTNRLRRSSLPVAGN